MSCASCSEHAAEIIKVGQWKFSMEIWKTVPPLKTSVFKNSLPRGRLDILHTLR